MKKILIVDDDEEIKRQLKWGLGQEYQILPAGSAAEAMALFREHRPKVATLDLGLHPHEEGVEEGLKVLSAILREAPLTKIIIITGNGQRENALRAVQAGAYDYFEKPIDLKELKIIAERAFHLYRIEQENLELHNELDLKGPGVFGMAGECPEMKKLFSTLERVGPLDVPVFITGESGTGKELMARAIHDLSLRKSGPFVSINCGAIPETLLESELFGHEKGAFTGAHEKVMGKVEYASGGTLFLDEIGELTANLQVKLLRFLQERTIQRVGGREDIDVDARILAATNVDIMEAISKKTFREDLYYRIGVITVNIPPLRQRGSDIMLLANFFLLRFSRHLGKKIKGLSKNAREIIKSHKWPGNVRELENRIKRAIIMADAPVLEVQDLGFAEGETPVKGFYDKKGLKEARDSFEKDFIVQAIRKSNGNMTRVAGELGVARPYLYSLIKKHEIRTAYGNESEGA